MANELSKIVDEVLKDIPTPEELTTELPKVEGGAYSKPDEKRASGATDGVSASKVSQGFSGKKKSGQSDSDSGIAGVKKQAASKAGSLSTPSVPKAPKPTISTTTKEQPITAI